MVGNSDVCPELVYAMRYYYPAKISRDSIMIIMLLRSLLYTMCANFSPVFFVAGADADSTEGDCPPELFYCGSECIVPRRVCDGYPDCRTDGVSDEEGCSKCC